MGILTLELPSIFDKDCDTLLSSSGAYFINLSTVKSIVCFWSDTKSKHFRLTPVVLKLRVISFERMPIEVGVGGGNFFILLPEIGTWVSYLLTS